MQFRASNDSSTTSGVLLFVENDSSNELHAHWGQNIYLKLSDKTTIYDIKYIHVGSKIAGVIYGTITVPSNITVPEKRSTEDVSSCALRSSDISASTANNFVAKWQETNLAPEMLQYWRSIRVGRM